MRSHSIVLLVLFGLVSSQTLTFSGYDFKYATESSGTLFDDLVNGVALDSLNNTYIIGATNGDLYGSWNDTSLTLDMIVAKFATTMNGTLGRLWERQISSSVQDAGYGIVLSPSEDYLYICGTYQSSPWVGILDPSTGASIANYSFSSYSNVSSNYPQFSDMAATSSSLYIVGFYPVTDFVWDSFVLKLDATSLTTQWTRILSSTYGGVLHAAAYETTASRLFAAGETSVVGVGSEFYLLELNPSDGTVLYERTWPGTSCGSRENFLTDIAVGTEYLYYLGASSQEFDSEAKPTSVCDYSLLAAVVGSLSLSNLSNHQWIYNVSNIGNGYLVKPEAIDLGDDGLIYFVGYSDSDKLLGHANTDKGGGYYDWFLAVLDSATGELMDFTFQGSSQPEVDDKATAIQTQTTHGLLTLGYNSVTVGNNFTVVQARDKPSDKSSGDYSTGVIVLAVLIPVGVVTLGAGAFLYWRKRRAHSRFVDTTSDPGL